MANEEHVKIARGGHEAIARFYLEESERVSERTPLELSGANLRGVDLSESDLRYAILSGANLSGANLKGAQLHGAELDGVILAGANLSSTHLVKLDLTDASLVGADLRNSKLMQTKLCRVRLNDAHLDCADLSYVDLTSADLSGAILHDTILTGASLRGAKLAAKTKFNEGTIVSGTKINSSSVEHIREKLGTARMMDMVIENDLVTLRCEFDGVWAVIHIASIFAFFTPHVFFLLKLCWLSTDRYPEGGLVLLEAFFRYELNGGVNWRVGWYFNHATFWPAVVFFVYNALRTVLLIKTRKLVMTEVASRLPSTFSFTDRVWADWTWLTWGKLHGMVKAGFFIYVLFVVCHVLVFSLNRWIDVKSLE